jgi:hypothetical protein
MYSLAADTNMEFFLIIPLITILVNALLILALQSDRDVDPFITVILDVTSILEREPRTSVIPRVHA